MHSFHKDKTKKRFLFAIVILLIFILINPFGIFDFVRAVTLVPLTSLARAGFGSGSYVSERIAMFANIGNLYRENQELAKQLREYKSYKAQLSDIRNENEQLRKELALLPRTHYALVGAEVVLRDPVGGDQWIMVNRGKKDGIEDGMAVIVDGGILIGVIDEINHATSRVRLITHPDSVVNVATERTGAEAIAYGKHGLSVVAEDIKKDDDVREGDVFVTSHIGDNFPRGLSVGTAHDIVPSSDNLFKTAQIIPLAPLHDLHFVFIIKSEV